MTKVLIITNKSDLTSDFIVTELKERRVDFYRFNTEELTKSVNVVLDFGSSKFFLFDKNSNKEVNLIEITSVYYRRPELPPIDISSLSNGEKKFISNEILYTLEGIYKVLEKAYWVSPLYSIRQAENKPYQLLLSKIIGFEAPVSLITNSPPHFNKFIADTKKNGVIKPIKSGLIEDDNESKIVFTSLISDLPNSNQQVESCPQFIQNHIEKKGDVRVTIVGDKIFAALIHSQDQDDTQIDWRKGEMSLEHSKIELPSDLRVKCVNLIKTLGLRFGAIDFILDKNDQFIFLEINPNGQWAWIERQTGYKISNEIVNLLCYENF